MKRLAETWSAISAGVLLVAFAWILYRGLYWGWILVAFAASAFLSALLRGRWRWAAFPALWGAGIAWTIHDPDLTRWMAFPGLVGASILLVWIIGQIPARQPEQPEVPRPPGAGVVLDVEVTSGRTGATTPEPDEERPRLDG